MITSRHTTPHRSENDGNDAAQSFQNDAAQSFQVVARSRKERTPPVQQPLPKATPIIEKHPSQHEERRMDSLARLLSDKSSVCIAVTFAPNGRLMVFSNHVENPELFCHAVAGRINRLRAFLAQNKIKNAYVWALSRQLMEHINPTIFPLEYSDQDTNIIEIRNKRQNYICNQLKRLHVACHSGYFRAEDLKTLMEGRIHFVLPDPVSQYCEVIKNEESSFHQHAEQMALAWHTLLYTKELTTLAALQRSMTNIGDFLHKHSQDKLALTQLATTLDIAMEELDEAIRTLPESTRKNRDIFPLIKIHSNYKMLRDRVKYEESDNPVLLSLRSSLQNEMNSIGNSLDAGEEKIDTSLSQTLSLCNEDENVALVKILGKNLENLLRGSRKLQSLSKYAELPVIGITKLCCTDCYQVLKTAGVTVAGTHNAKFNNTFNFLTGKADFLPTKERMQPGQNQAPESDTDESPEAVLPSPRKLIGGQVGTMFHKDNRCIVKTSLHESLKDTYYLTVAINP